MPDLRSNAKASKHAEGAALDPGQSAILQAITSLKTELLVKIDEKAERHNTEICKQISTWRGEMKAAIEHAKARANALEERTASLEVAASSPEVCTHCTHAHAEQVSWLKMLQLLS